MKLTRIALVAIFAASLGFTSAYAANVQTPITTCTSAEPAFRYTLFVDATLFFSSPKGAPASILLENLPVNGGPTATATGSMLFPNGTSTTAADGTVTVSVSNDDQTIPMEFQTVQLTTKLDGTPGTANLVTQGVPGAQSAAVTCTTP